MALIILLLLLIGLVSTSAQIPHYVPLPHCVPCTEPFQQFDYNKACDDLQNSTGYIDEYQQLLVPVFDIQLDIQFGYHFSTVKTPSVSLCVPCNGSSVDFYAKCDDFRNFLESQRLVKTNKCNEENHEVFFEGRCQTLLEQGSCPESHWLVINDIRTGPVCEYNNCFDSTSFSVYYEGSCLNLNTEDWDKICEEDKWLAVSPDGTADCECFFDEMVKLPKSEECFSTRNKTSVCAPDWVLGKSFDGNPVCVLNFCSDDEIYLHGRCWQGDRCNVGVGISFEPKPSDFNKHKNTFQCSPQPPTYISGSHNARPIGNCILNAARISGVCPRFTTRKKLPFV